MLFKVNVNWTASVNKIVETEAESREEAREKVLGRCVEYGGYNRSSPSDVPFDGKNDGGIYPDNPDSVEYYLEEELCEVI